MTRTMSRMAGRAGFLLKDLLSTAFAPVPAGYAGALGGASIADSALARATTHRISCAEAPSLILSRMGMLNPDPILRQVPLRDRLDGLSPP